MAQRNDLPPFDSNAEMSVLGSIFLENKCFGHIRTSLTLDDFYKQAHRVIFKAFTALRDQKRPIDFVTACQQLHSTGDLEAAGGGAYVTCLADYVPTASNVKHYCRIVIDCSVRRKLILKAREMASAAYDLTVPMAELADLAKRGVSEIVSGVSGVSADDLLSLQDRAARYTKYVQQVNEFRFRTGFGDIDNHIRGVAPGEVLTIIAYSGTFKSALLQNLLQGNAERTQRHQLFFSLEMPVEKTFEREVQIQCGVSGLDVERTYSEKQEHTPYHAKLLSRNSDKLIVCERSKLNIDRLSAYIELAKYKYGEIGGVGIDYLGLLQAEGKSVFDKVSALSADIKGMAKDLRVPVVMLCQVNRGYAASKNVEIEMDAAKGGGDIEAGADFMLGMWAKDKRLFAKLLKNRNGDAGERWEIDIDRRTLQFLGTMPYTGDGPSTAMRSRTDDLPDF